MDPNSKDYNLSRDDSIYFARLSEQGERYEDMIGYMKQVASHPQELSNDERNLLSVAFKNSVKTRRDAWRTIKAIQNKEELKGNKFLPLIVDYRDKIEKELKDICVDLLDLLDKSLLKQAAHPEAIVFFMKMKGDYYRYLGEFMTGDEKKGVIESAQDSYK